MKKKDNEEIWKVFSRIETTKKLTNKDKKILRKILKESIQLMKIRLKEDIK